MKFYNACTTSVKLLFPSGYRTPTSLTSSPGGGGTLCLWLVCDTMETPGGGGPLVVKTIRIFENKKLHHILVVYFKNKTQGIAELSAVKASRLSHKKKHFTTKL